MMAELSPAAAWAVWILVLIVSETGDALFCGLEIGVYVMNKSRLDLHAEAGHGDARRLKRLVDRPNRLLAVILIGTNIARYWATFAISAMFILAGYETQTEWYTMAVATPVLFIVGDSVPKVTFQRLGAAAVYNLSWMLRAFDWVFLVTGLTPLVVALSMLIMRLTGSKRISEPSLGHQGVAAVMAEGHASGVLTQFQSVMADRVMHLKNVTVEDVMIPMRQTVTVRAGRSRQDVLEAFREHEFSRLPMKDEGGKVIGILSLFDAFEADERQPRPSGPPLVLPGKMVVSEALYRMRRARQPMAVVTKGDVHVGIVTIKDLVEEIVGEIEQW